ncbi:MAG TPA: ribonucleotide-diphosphate reductase subunit beta [Solirubrobacteraceae bacterium]|jgi:ribonucleoside-diphosphate reductase beta chain|nr:ribonucleotide-diphosphate reductase subunit beta [Solirubrobacteraceae bacterium]
MTSLLELASQGDVGTIVDESKLSAVTLMTPQQLYELWERQNWQSHTIDFSQDVRDWRTMDDEEREQLAWNLSSFFVGEERVTTQFAGLVMAYESQSEEAFLTTQQVDEARHAQHFNRFYEQVLKVDGTFEDRLRRAREDLNPAFIELFDVVLVEWGRRLVEDPTSIEAKVDFVTLYHMIIEGTLALTGQNFLTDYMERKGILPGWVEGFKLISQDEHRHVAYGTWLLREKAQDPALRERIGQRVVELLPLANRVLVPRGANPQSYAILDYTMEETNAFAFSALNRRLKVIGIDLARVTAPAA